MIDPITAPTAAPTGPPAAAPIAPPTIIPPTGSAFACAENPSIPSPAATVAMTSDFLMAPPPACCSCHTLARKKTPRKGGASMLLQLRQGRYNSAPVAVVAIAMAIVAMTVVVAPARVVHDGRTRIRRGVVAVAVRGSRSVRVPRGIAVAVATVVVAVVARAHRSGDGADTGPDARAVASVDCVADGRAESAADQGAEDRVACLGLGGKGGRRDECGGAGDDQGLLEHGSVLL